MGRLVLFEIGNVSFYTHGLFFVLAIVFSAMALFFVSQSFSKNKWLILDIGSWSLIFGIIIARIFYIVMYPDKFYGIKDYFSVSQGGLISWGGYAGGLAIAYFIIKSSKESLVKWMDTIFICGMLGISVGRLGCLLSGELAGKQYNGLLSISNRYPTTLFESALALVIFILLIVLYKKRLFYDGLWWKLSLALYSIGRFVIDFTRAEDVYYLGLSLGQILSLTISVLLFVLIIRDFNKRGRNNG